MGSEKSILNYVAFIVREGGRAVPFPPPIMPINFAILYFGIMLTTGTFTPMMDAVVSKCKGNSMGCPGDEPGIPPPFSLGWAPPSPSMPVNYPN